MNATILNQKLFEESFDDIDDPKLNVPRYIQQIVADREARQLAAILKALKVKILSKKGHNFDLERTALTQLLIPTLSQLTGYFDCDNNSYLTSLSLPELTSVGGNFYCDHNVSLASLSLPMLARVGYNFYCYSNAALTSLSVPRLASVGRSFYCDLNPSLTDVDLSSYLPTNNIDHDFSGSALTAASVNHILARCVANPVYVAGTVCLNGGTNAAPTGQGIMDRITLRRRGVVVTTN